MARKFLYDDADAGRWVPPWLRAQRETRYIWAAEFVSGHKVLEVGCGSGSGTAALHHQGALGTIGVDVDADAITRASQQYAQADLQFLATAGPELPFESRQFHVVVSLETIEHVQDHLVFINELTRVLAADGCLLLSTPNRRVTNPGTARTARPANPLHVCEWTREELAEELASRFEQVDWLGQTFHSPASVQWLTRLGKVIPAAGVRWRQFQRLSLMPFESPAQHAPRKWQAGYEPEVLIAVCRRPQVPASVCGGDS